MKYFKDNQNTVYAYEDSDEGFVLGDLTAISEAEAMRIANPPPTPEDLIAESEAKKSQLRSVADAEIAWRQDAVDAGVATAEEAAALAEWKKYRVLLMRVDTAAPVWPPVPGEQATKNSV